MNTKQEKIEAKLTHLQPILKSAGRTIAVDSIKENSITFLIKGFCSGCACSSSYKEGLEELVASTCPELTEIKFIEE